MEETTLKQETLEQKRIRFFKRWDGEYPPIRDFVVTSSGIVEPIPEDQEGRDRLFNENKKFGGI